jgi:magnesium-transporting ATPase (P-type)
LPCLAHTTTFFLFTPAKQLRLSENLTSTGLSDEQAATRLEEFGLNKMTEARKKTLIERIWNQVNNVLVLILVIVAVVSGVRAITAEPGSQNVVTNWIQVGIIVGVIVINTWIGIVQEGSAEKAAEALKSMLSSDARVMRGGQEKMIPAQDLVPGDIVYLGLGDKVPCDLRVISSANLACQEAALTGESVPIDKTVDPIEIPAGGNPMQTPLGDRHNMCFSATLVAQGSGVGIAIATGDGTQIGTINALVSQVEEKKTAVLEQIDTVSKYLAAFIVLCAVVTFLIAFFVTKLEAIDAVSIALVAAVAMIPEGLEAIVTVTYAYAVSNMAKHNAIVRALPAVETLGSVTVICSDKTGTLTTNVMSLTAFVTSNARYKVDVHSRDRSNTNFVRDDTFMATRADHTKGKHTAEIVDSGPTGKGAKRGKHGSSFHYAVDHLESEHGTQADEPAKSTTDGGDDTPVPNGSSPDTPFLKSALSGGILCSKCVLGENGTREGEIGNPTELSILRAVYFTGVDIDDMKKVAPVVAEVPFSSEYKFMATVHEPVPDVDGKDLDGKYVVHVKGAPDRMVPLCKYQAKAGVMGENEPMDSAYWIEQIAILSSHGLRVLALCRSSIDKSEVKEGDQLGPEFVNGRSEPWLTMMGLCAIVDPPRPECVQAIKEAHVGGIRVAMITGDHKDTAVAIGHQLGIVTPKYSEAVTGPEMDAMSDDELRVAVMNHNVFARASPQNKIRIVKALQAEGQVSSMTGDGVNDAPALKAADMGVAMGKEGTDVAREASEMILADDNFATIVTAVKEGRVVWDNLRKVLLVNTPINNSQGLSVLFGFALGLSDTPLTAIQVLYSNLICAVTLGFVCAVEPAEDGIMEIPPRRVGKRLIGRYLFLRIALGTAILTTCVVGSSFWSQSLGYTLEQNRAIAFNTLDFGAISITASARFTYNSSFSLNVFKGNNSLIYSAVIVTCLQLLCTYTPGLNDVIFGMDGMDGIQWGIVILFMFSVFCVMEAEKALRRKLKAQGKDTDDLEEGAFDQHFEPPPAGTRLLPKGGSKLNVFVGESEDPKSSATKKVDAEISKAEKDIVAEAENN